MYAVSIRAQIKEGRIEELKDFIKSDALPRLEVPGMISIGFFSPDPNINLGMAFLESKEAADIFAEERNKNLAAVSYTHLTLPTICSV